MQVLTDKKSVRSFDPGRTRKLHRAFSANATMQLNRLRAMLRQAIVDYNILGLSGPSNFTFMTPAARLNQFAGWLETAANASLDARWWVHPWIDRATQHGLKSAQLELSGSEYQPIPTTFESLHQLAHDELRGIIGALVQKVMRAAHVATNRRMVPHMAYREMVKPIDGDIRNRLNLLAHLLTVKGHVKGKVAYYWHAGVTHVGINPELRFRNLRHDHSFIIDRRKKRDDDDEVNWATAGDDLVCEDCQDMADGGPYALDEVEDLIPLHANCRCDLVIWDGPVSDSIRFICDGYDPDEERDPYGKWVSGGSPKELTKETAMITPDHIEAMASYKAHYEYINDVASGNSDKVPFDKFGPHFQLEHIQGLVKNLDDAVSKSILKKDTTVLRVIDSPEIMKNANKLVGKDLPSYGFNSTTTDKAVTENMLHPTIIVKGQEKKNLLLIMIDVKKGQHGLNMQRRYKGVPGYKESEILLSRFGKLHVNSFDKKNKVIHASWIE